MKYECEQMTCQRTNNVLDIVLKTLRRNAITRSLLRMKLEKVTIEASFIFCCLGLHFEVEVNEVKTRGRSDRGAELKKIQPGQRITWFIGVGKCALYFV